SIGRLLAPTAHQQVRCSRWLLAPSLTFSSGDDVGFSPELSRFQFLLRFLGSLVPINFRCPQSIASSSLELLTRFFSVCGVSTARVISTASSLRRPVSGVSGGSAASSSGDDSPVVVSLAGHVSKCVRRLALFEPYGEIHWFGCGFKSSMVFPVDLDEISGLSSMDLSVGIVW
ncbi:hypothetical protein IGI04_001051, partial [Brassica rapa subsp. trilocularis]